MSRKIETSIDVDPHGDWRLSAECVDELTSMLVLNPVALFGDARPADVLASLSPGLIAEHRARCGSCQKVAA